MIKNIAESNSAKYNVIIYDINKEKMICYDVVPYFEHEYGKLKKKDQKNIKTFDDLKNFIKGKAMYQFWSRCEYEIILSDWPPSGRISEKWDVYDQIIMNLELVTIAVINKLNIKLK